MFDTTTFVKSFHRLLCTLSLLVALRLVILFNQIISSSHLNLSWVGDMYSGDADTYIPNDVLNDNLADVQDEDFDAGGLNNFICHILDLPRTARKKKIRTSLKHLGRFNHKYHNQFSAIGVLPTIDPARLPWEIVNNETYVGCFTNYLATEATYLAPGRTHELLMHSTTAGYASTFRTYYLNYFRDRGPPIPLQQETWNRKIKELTKKKCEHHQSTGTPMKQSKPTATNSDRENINLISIWKGDNKGAQVFHLMNTSHNLAGRASDVGNSDLNDIGLCELTEETNSYNIITQNCKRIKTDDSKVHHIFPHRENCLFDYNFSLLYLLLVGSVCYGDSTKLFPIFASKLFNSESKVDSRVSQAVISCMNDIWQIIYDYANGKNIPFLAEIKL